MTQIIRVFLASIDPNIILGVKVSLGFILLDTLLGVILALKTGTFAFKLFPKFLVNNIFPYVSSLLILAFFSIYDTADKIFYGLFLTACTGISIKFGVEAIKEKLLAILGVTIPVPTTVSRFLIPQILKK
jgi:hypothetical protein